MATVYIHNLKQVFLFLYFICLTVLVAGQSGSDDDQNCVYRKRFSKAERRQHYPFNKYSTVKLISFRYHKNDYPIKQDSLILDSMVQIKILGTGEIDQLTDILFNNFQKRKNGIGSVTQCFFPRNAILFFDDRGRLKESVLICFHCNRYRFSSDKIEFGDRCRSKFEKLRALFISFGVNFGTDLSVDVFPGEEHN